MHHISYSFNVLEGTSVCSLSLFWQLPYCWAPLLHQGVLNETGWSLTDGEVKLWSGRYDLPPQACDKPCILDENNMQIQKFEVLYSQERIQSSTSYSLLEILSDGIQGFHHRK